MDFETSIEGDTVDKIAYRRRGTVAIVEAIYALNRGLARLGAVLPAGVRVYLPPPPTARTVRKVPRIWS